MRQQPGLVSPDAWGAVATAITTVGAVLVSHITTRRRLVRAIEITDPVKPLKEMTGELRALRASLDRHLLDHASAELAVRRRSR